MLSSTPIRSRMETRKETTNGWATEFGTLSIIAFDGCRWKWWRCRFPKKFGKIRFGRLTVYRPLAQCRFGRFRSFSAAVETFQVPSACRGPFAPIVKSRVTYGPRDLKFLSPHPLSDPPISVSIWQSRALVRPWEGLTSLRLGSRSNTAGPQRESSSGSSDLDCRVE